MVLINGLSLYRKKTILFESGVQMEASSIEMVGFSGVQWGSVRLQWFTWDSPGLGLGLGLVKVALLGSLIGEKGQVLGQKGHLERTWGPWIGKRLLLLAVCPPPGRAWFLPAQGRF